MNENLIDQYLLNNLSREERIAFELQLTKDKGLANEFNLQKNVLSDIEGLGRIDLKNKLQRMHSELNFDTQKHPTKVRNMIFRIAAAAVFIGVLAASWMWIQTDYSSDDLYAQHFSPYEISVAQRSEGSTNLMQIQNLYDNGDYNAAIPLFEKVINSSDPIPSQMQLGLGISLLETNNCPKAIEQFQNILLKNDFNYEDEAAWYLSLAYLRSNKLDKAIEHLSTLASDAQRDHHLEAKKLLSKVK